MWLGSAGETFQGLGGPAGLKCDFVPLLLRK